jgi:hypothetical protein
MFGAVDIGILFDVMRMDGYMQQLPLPLDTPPEYTLPEEYFADIPMGYKWINSDSNVEGGDQYVIDHPGFTRLRDSLEGNGYIKTERNRSNGDRVLKRFRLNGRWFDEGEKFPCAVAMRGVLKLGYMRNLRYKCDYKTKAVEFVLSQYEFEDIGDLFDRDMVDIERIVRYNDNNDEYIEYRITSK